MKFARTPTGSLALSVAVALTVGLSACHKGTHEEPQAAASMDAGPAAKPGMSLSDGVLMLPIVKGHPGAVYFTLTNGSSNPVSLVSAYVEGAARAEMHETVGGSMKARDKVNLTPGDTVKFAPGGLHVMVFGLPANLTAGGTTELTLTFADGDKISAPLAIKAMGSGSGPTPMSTSDMDSDSMAGMHH